MWARSPAGSVLSGSRSGTDCASTMTESPARSGSKDHRPALDLACRVYASKPDRLTELLHMAAFNLDQALTVSSDSASVGSLIR